MRNSKVTTIGLLLTALWAGVLGWMVVSQEYSLRTGETVLLEIAGYDPRDLLRGDYVQFQLDVVSEASETLRNRLKSRRTEDFDPRYYQDTAYILLQEEPDGISRLQSVVLDEALIQGPYLSIPLSSRGWLDSPYTRYYVPEGTGLQIEDNLRDGVEYVIQMQLGSDGTGIITALQQKNEE